MHSKRLFPLALVALVVCVSIGLRAGGELSPAQADAPLPEAAQTVAVAIFAGGCFWCMEPPFDAIDGVFSTTSGYIGGHVENPTYKQVSSGRTGHTEALKIEFDPEKVDFQALLEVFWKNIDPTVVDRQFCDAGNQYRSGIFYVNDEQRVLAMQSRENLEKTKPFKQPIVTEITAASPFYAAEEYHQDYYQKNPLRYKFYRTSCGRDRRLRELWG